MHFWRPLSHRFAYYEGKLFELLEEAACQSSDLFAAFLKPAPSVRLSTEVARMAGEYTSSVDANFADSLRPLFLKLICEFRKVRQADFFKVIQRKNRDESDSLRRHLKNIGGKASAEEIFDGAAPAVEMDEGGREVLEEVERNFADEIERDSAASDNEYETSESAFVK